MKAGKICYVFGAGEYYNNPPPISNEDYVIAADGGYDYVCSNGYRTDLIIGDFDSLFEVPKHENIRVLPIEKDDTDMAAGIKAGLDEGCSIFRIYGGTGGRLDHTLANIQCLAELSEHGARGYLYDKETVITAITNTSISFPEASRGMISVFSHSDKSIGVYEIGLKYPLTNATLINLHPLGISNEFTGLPASVGVRLGTLIVIYSNDIKEDENEKST